MTRTNENEYDVVIVGGGAAGLSAAVSLGRSRRSVLVIDAGEPRNAPAAGVHNFLSRDGVNPLELQRLGRDEVERYGGRVARGSAVTASRTDEGFVVTMEGGSVVRGRRLLVASGVVDELPSVVGLQERWGKDVVHCPYCHGWEVRDQAIGILATGPMAMHQAMLFRQLSATVTFFAHTAPPLTDEEREQLAARDIRVVEGIVESLEVVDDALAGVLLADGARHPVQALAVATTLTARSEILGGLGVKPTAHPMGVGTYIESDATGLTSAAGVWVAGNVTDPVAQVVTAASDGLRAGAAINADLIAEEVREAIAARATA
ncbi:NAD(P)/FAD-dependent oxidoreductase [Leifsonia sp. Root112D2]|uniref:NAD(P)/FAD-dependent oxidoreductase n=1 Tax=Leifsonia sp. Root112D2 TaxID=1736426 RepID=UPI0006F26816|nr:NAD(P)/FAD-dependent oxidoreductase [Leifsonia sp. Root112D2]KQV08358.1 thioredoxin reductase [Leifsonia sp. Root112D2]